MSLGPGTQLNAYCILEMLTGERLRLDRRLHRARLVPRRPRDLLPGWPSTRPHGRVVRAWPRAIAGALLFEVGDPVFSSLGLSRFYDVSPDGKRFVMVSRGSQAVEIPVVLEWDEELNARVPSE